MLILTKSIICLILGFILAIICGAILIPLYKKKKVSQVVSNHINVRHQAKKGTPTMGGIIFIMPVLLIILFLYLNGSIKLQPNFLLVIFVFVSFALLGFLDDFVKIKFKNNKGLSILTKFLIQNVIAMVFFWLFLVKGNSTVVTLFGASLDLKAFYGILILLMLVGSSNATNITDGLDGLCAGLCAISFLTYGIISWNSPFILGNQEIAIFCFILVGSLLGFLFYNFYPAKIFMGDLGSLALGASLSGVAIVLKNEFSLILIGFVYIIETLSSLIQILMIRLFNKKILLKSPLHHHFEELNYCESDIIKIFYSAGLLFSLISLIVYVWL